MAIKKTLQNAKAKTRRSVLTGKRVSARGCRWPCGYADYLAAIHGKNHPEHDVMVAWDCEDFEPGAFDTDEIKVNLKRTRR